MRSMQDSDITAGFHAGAHLYAAYIPPGHDNYESMVAAYPDAKHVSIATRFTTDAQVLDWEASTTGTGSPGSAVTWVTRQRARGNPTPTVYVQTGLLFVLVRAFAAAKIDPPQWWTAHWTNVPHIEPGSVATQWGGAPGVDYSQVQDYWPGIDPSPLTEMDDDMPGYALPHIVCDETATNNAALVYPDRVVIIDNFDTTKDYEAISIPAVGGPIIGVPVVQIAHSTFLALTATVTPTAPIPPITLIASGEVTLAPAPTV